MKQGTEPATSATAQDQPPNPNQCELTDAAFQERYRAAHLEQLRRRACPGCGEGDVIPAADSIVQRPLDLNDLAQAHRQTDEELNHLAAPILADLLAIETVTGADAAGIARRGGSVFAPLLEGRRIEALAAAYVLLRRAGAQTALIDQIEVARGVI